MKKKEKFLAEYFENKRNDISFVTLKEGATIDLGSKEYTTFKEIPVPIRIDKLVQEIENQNIHDGITIKNIIDGMIYIFGTDRNFEYADEYLNILDELEFDVKPFIISCINKDGEENADEAVIYGKALVNLLEDEKTCFVYASALENKSKGYIYDEKSNAGKYFMDEALFYYEKCLDYNDRFSLSYYKLGYYYRLKQQYIKAKLFWTKHQEYDDDIIRIEEIRVELKQLEPYVDFENGYKLVIGGDYEDGLSLLLPLVEDYGGWWNLLFFIGVAYRALKQYDIAEKYFENVLVINDEQKESLNELGLCKMCLGKYKDAAELFTTLLNIEPGSCEIFCNRATAHLYNNEIDRAKEDIETALKIYPKDEIALRIKNEIEAS